MASDSMAAPLGLGPRQGPRGVPRSWRRALVITLVLCLAGLAVLSILRRSPVEPGVVAIITRQAAVVERKTDETSRTGTSVQITRPAGTPAPGGGLVIRVPDGMTHPGGADLRVGERTQLGILPRIADDGTPPRLAYARAFTPSGKPMIAIVMTGVGIGQRGTAEAISKLKGEVTLAFAPYGRDLEAQVMRARREGHEILLQVPMEPFDYPESDPGPHTLKAGGEPRENIERLHWLMSRFTGYVGLMNFMGGKLMTERGVYGSLLSEINRRGLVFLDDGTTPETRSAEIGKQVGIPILRADRTLEPGTARTVEALLADAEDIARRNGRAIVALPALPANIEKIAAWTRGLGERGLVLAPVSAMIAPGTR